MTETEVPEGVRNIAELSGESVTDLWSGLRGTLNSPEKIQTFNEVVAQTVKDQLGSGRSGLEVAHLAMSAAGDAILGTDRPSSLVEAVIQSAGPILRRVR